MFNMFALVFFTTNAFIIYFSHYTSRDIAILINVNKQFHDIILREKDKCQPHLQWHQILLRTRPAPTP